MPRPAPLVLAMVFLAGCGSTVAQTSQTSSAGSGAASTLGGQSGQLGPVATQQAGSTEPGALTPVGVAGGQPGSPGPLPSNAPAGPGFVAPSTPVGARVRAPGVTDKTITVGLPYGTNGQAAAAAFGATGAGAGGGDGKAIWTVALKLVNGAGGILGRQVVPVFHPIDSTSTQSQATIEQSMCSDFTEDHKVFWAAVSSLKTATPCLSKAGVSQSTSNPTDAGTAFYRQYPNYIEAGTLQMDRVAASMPAFLQRQGWFSPWNTVTGKPAATGKARIGIVAFDDNYTKHAVNDILVPALQRYAPDKAEVVFIATPQSAADNGPAIAAIQNTTVRFRNDGVTHVIPFETQGAGIGVFVSQGADKQRYYPRYGVNSGNAVQLYIDQGLWPTTELGGLLGFGWSPLLDLSNNANPDNGPYSNDTRRRCLTLMRKNSIDVSSAIIKRQALEYCNDLSFLKAALESGGSAISATSFREGAERLGSTYQSPLTFGTRFGPGRHDGVALVRTLSYTADCSCMRYGKDLIPVG